MTDQNLNLKLDFYCLKFIVIALKRVVSYSKVLLGVPQIKESLFELKCKGLDVRNTNDLHIEVDNLIQNLSKLAVNYHIKC